MKSLVDAIDSRQILVLSLEFDENVLQVAYQEKRHIGQSAMKVQQMTIAIDTDKKQEQYLALQDDIIDMIDDADRDIIENPIEE